MPILRRVLRQTIRQESLLSKHQWYEAAATRVTGKKQTRSENWSKTAWTTWKKKLEGHQQSAILLGASLHSINHLDRAH